LVENQDKNKREIPTTKSINSAAFGMSTDLDTNNPFESEAVYAGDSVDEHVTLEEANTYLAEKEIKQVFENQ